MKHSFYKIFSALLFIASSFQSCVEVHNTYSKIAPGTWRAVLHFFPTTITPNVKGQRLPEKLNLKMEEFTEGDLPFTLDINYKTENDVEVVFHNAEEDIRIGPEDIFIGRDKRTGLDTIRINFTVYNTYIKAIYRERVMEGEWVSPAKKSSIPFEAHQGQNYRFTQLAKPPIADLTGNFETTFNDTDSTSYKAVGEFKQNGNALTGTFRTETGDYRYLQGEVQADKIYLSCFDGSHAFLFEGKALADKSFSGIFRAGKSNPEIFTAKFNPNATLANSDALTKAIAPSSPINFSFTDANGKMVSLDQLGDKVKIIQIMGTWCPNCRDETNFLKDYLANNPNKDVAVVALAFERNPEVAMQQIKVYKEKMQLPYQLLLAGTSTNKDSTSKKLPFLDKVMAYPTLIHLDRKNRIRNIHTGFDGPATSKYADYKKEFSELTEKLLSEK